MNDPYKAASEELAKFTGIAAFFVGALVAILAMCVTFLPIGCNQAPESIPCHCPKCESVEAGAQPDAIKQLQGELKDLKKSVRELPQPAPPCACGPIPAACKCEPTKSCACSPQGACRCGQELRPAPAAPKPAPKMPKHKCR